MNEPSPSGTPSTPETPETPETPAPEGERNLLKGCGCGVGLGVMALGILIAGDFDATSWTSASMAIVVGVLVWLLSGTQGFWER